MRKPDFSKPWAIRQTFDTSALIKSFSALPERPKSFDPVAAIYARIDFGVDSDGIGRICIEGVIADADPWLCYYFGFVPPVMISQAFDRLLNDDRCQMILMLINSPGGETTGIAELADKIYHSSKPVTAVTTKECCSAAYWIASQASVVCATRSALIGSIGVYMLLIDETEMLKKYGLNSVLITTGELKGMGSAGQPLTEAQHTFLQNHVNDVFAQFDADISRRRAIAPEWKTGGFWLAEKALAANLIDEALTAPALAGHE